MRAGRRVSKLVLRHGMINDGGAAWTDSQFTPVVHRQ
jgi:hypothetical protein